MEKIYSTILLCIFSLAVFGQTTKKTVPVRKTAKTIVKANTTAPAVKIQEQALTLPALMNRYQFQTAINQLQRDITAKRNKKQATEEEQRELKKAQLGEKMLGSTQKIVFIDSIITTYDNFISNIRLSDESGSILTYNKFFNTNNQSNCYVYVNELGNKCYFSKSDGDDNIQLFTSDMLAGTWSEPTSLNGLDNTFEQMNYPYMMSDGTTLYFAATGAESLGGYDIFVTRYDSETGKFLKPENLGMPFNSPSNDYMYAEDELNNIGWFVTDRDQSEGNVCIYIFIPSETRQVYESGKYTDDKIRRAARICSIAETWGDGADRLKALQRLEAARKSSNKQESDKAFAFVINDDITYTSLDNFKSENTRLKMTEVINQKKQLSEMENNLEAMRDKYSGADNGQKSNLKTEILNAEKETNELRAKIATSEKLMRKVESKYIK